MRFTIAAYPVDFPHAPYGIQFKYMEQVLKTLDAGGNALLEAPTGSGKTLALLCSALAWQKAKREGSYKAIGRHVFGASEGVGSPQSGRGSAAPVQKPYQIYYATRTHAQITQVVEELKRTQYRPKTTILAARKHYCVNNKVVNSGRMDEACDEVVKEGTCKFFKGQWRLTTDEISNQILDIEELVSEGKLREGCPYFASRHLREQADVVFCPYTYLADPVVRTAMEISLSQAVLILDEAHNIEDVARSGASQEVELDVLKAVQMAYAKAHDMCMAQAASGVVPVTEGLCQAFELLKGTFKRLTTLLEDLSYGQCGNLVPKQYEQYERVWDSQQAVELLEATGIGPSKMMQLTTAYKLARKAHDDQVDPPDGPQSVHQENQGVVDAGGMALGITSSLLSVLGMFYTPRWTSAYRLVVKKWVQRGAVKQRQHRRWMVDTDQGQWAVQLCLWCLDPAVAFSQIVEQTHSVLLTSGTLSPLESFSSELGARFGFRLETPHVIDMVKQVWGGAVAAGPDGQFIKCVHKEVNKLEFQDRIGELLLQWCQAVPDGVLVFLPSYSLMDKLTGRWKETGMWKKLMEIKPLFCEPRSAGEQFDLVVDKYYKSIECSNGGMLLGVCRGKASEGMNFADKYARSVVIIGIPYPNLKDTNVELKMQYNDVLSCNQGHLSGDKWYTQQAFRALNQSLGRCIRHRRDFGAILLVDARFRESRFLTKLSRWVRTAVVQHSDFAEMVSTVQSFFKDAEQECGPPVLDSDQDGMVRPDSCRNDMKELASVNALEKLGKKQGSEHFSNTVQRGQTEQEHMTFLDSDLPEGWISGKRVKICGKSTVGKEEESGCSGNSDGSVHVEPTLPLNQLTEQQNCGIQDLQAGGEVAVANASKELGASLHVSDRQIGQDAGRAGCERAGVKPFPAYLREACSKIECTDIKEHGYCHLEAAETTRYHVDFAAASQEEYKSLGGSYGLQGPAHEPAPDDKDITMGKIDSLRQSGSPCVLPDFGYRNSAAQDCAMWNSGPKLHNSQPDQCAGRVVGQRALLQGESGFHGGACGVSFSLILEWAEQDVQGYEEYLCQHHPYDRDLGNLTYRRSVAAMGVLDCFSMAAEVLTNSGNLHGLWSEWCCNAPIGLAAILEPQGMDVPVHLRPQWTAQRMACTTLLKDLWPLGVVHISVALRMVHWNVVLWCCVASLNGDWRCSVVQHRSGANHCFL